MTTLQTLEMALEALDWEDCNDDAGLEQARNKAITALRQQIALEKMAENARELGLDYEPADEPMALGNKHDMPHGWVTNWPHPNGGTRPVYHASAIKPKYGEELDGSLTVYPVYTRPQPAAQCEYIRHTKEGTHWCALAEKPSAWVGLTDEEIVLVCAECAASAHRHDDISYARAIEAKLKEKNT